MGKEKLPIMTLDMFDPMGGSRKTREGYSTLLRFYFGEPGIKFLEGLQSGKFSSASIANHTPRVSEYYFNKVKDTLGLPDHITPRSSFDKAGSTAITVVRQLADMTDLSIANDPLADEISTNPTNPTGLLYYLALQPGGESAHLEFNARRHFLLSSISQEIEANSGNGVVRDTLFNTQIIFNEQLYEDGKKGVKVPYTGYSRHHAVTNRFLGFTRPPFGNNYEDVRILANNFSTRRLKDTGDLVYTTLREKDPAAAAQKALALAEDNQGIVRPDKIEDLMGIKVMVIEGNGITPHDKSREVVNRIHDRFVSVLQENHELKEVRSEDSVDKTRGQADLDWRRSKLFLVSVPVPIEFVVVGEGENLDGTYEVGTVDPETGLYDGKAHDLYVIRRSRSVARRLLPSDIYRFNPDAGLRRKSQEKANQLLNSRSVVRSVGNGGGYI